MKNNGLSLAGEPAGVPLQCPTAPRHRILVVDQDSDLRLLYAAVLLRPGFHVDAAEDGAAGWEALHATHYDLLITDNDVPKVSGVELVRKLRAARMALPVVMAAVRLPTHELARNPSLQIAATLPKPFSIDELLGTVEGVLRAANGAGTRIKLLPDWRSQLSADGLRL